MIRSQPSVMSVMVKSTGEYEDESIPCCQTAGSLGTEQKTIHGSSPTDGCRCLAGESERERGDELYDTCTVDTCRHQRVDVTDRLIGSGFQQKANIGFVDRPAPYTDQTRAVASQHLENKSHVGSG
ncbi:hypothetical protein F2P81_015585 [Scophthalmus maximus]|uniref:Uncharacterized protein n=1 Tax=Scophthalmus maximus TaxID=52904 RepID=A0A6A4SL68_SCOMX|nr:hypothetical protein F2P81_015585 [Scophthalmus maximus]